MPQAKAKTKSKSNAIYSVHPSVVMVQSWVMSLPLKTGRSLDQWIRLVEEEGPASEKERREWLKDRHQLGTNAAGWIVDRAAGRGLEDGDPDAYLRAADGYVAAMFTGRKAGLRRLYDELLKLGMSLGDDVRACPCQTIVPLYRRHVFAQIKPATNTRIDLGLSLKRHPGAGAARLTPAAWPRRIGSPTGSRSCRPPTSTRKSSTGSDTPTISMADRLGLIRLDTSLASFASSPSARCSADSVFSTSSRSVARVRGQVADDRYLTMLIWLPVELNVTWSMKVRISRRPRPPIRARSSGWTGRSNSDVSKPGPSSPMTNRAASRSSCILHANPSRAVRLQSPATLGQVVELPLVVLPQLGADFQVAVEQGIGQGLLQRDADLHPAGRVAQVHAFELLLRRGS